MDGNLFKLATLAKPGGSPFAAIVLGDDAVELAAAHAVYRSSAGKGALCSSDGIQGLLENWDKNFSVLQEIAAFLEKEGRPGALELPSLRALPPVMRPGKMLYAAQNFQEHVDEMLRAGMTPASGPKFTGDKSALCLSSTGGNCRRLCCSFAIVNNDGLFDFSFACRPKKADVRGRNSPGSYRLCPLHSWRSNSAETDR